MSAPEIELPEHAPWCNGACMTPTECSVNPWREADEPEVIADGEKISPIARLELLLVRSLEPDFRAASLRDDETCVISIGVGDGQYIPEQWLHLTPARARLLSERLQHLIRLAGEDAEVARWRLDRSRALLRSSAVVAEPAGEGVAYIGLGVAALVGSDPGCQVC